MDLKNLIEPEKPNSGPSDIRKAIIWGQEDLLSQAVSLFLEAGMTWEVIKVSNTDNFDVFIHKIQMIKPAVVILCQDIGREDPIIPMKVIDALPCLKVISLSLADNLIKVYSKKDVVVQGGTDLLSIVEPEKSSSCTPGKEA